jgi:hypothetical protein
MSEKSPEQELSISNHESNLSDSLPSNEFEFSMLTPQQKDLIQSLNSVEAFKDLLKRFYKELGFDSGKFQAASPQIDYLFNLFTMVFKLGGWSTMNGTNGWTGLSKCFGYMQPAKLREDYDSFLFALEKSYGLFAFDRKTVENFLLDLSPELMVICEWYQPNMLVNEITKPVILRMLNVESMAVPKFIDGMLGVDLKLFSKQGLADLQFNHDLSIKKLSEFEESSSFYLESALQNYEQQYQELSSKLPSLLHWNGIQNLLRYSVSILGVNKPSLIVLKDSYTLIGGPSYLNINGIYTFLEGKSECFGIHFQHVQLLHRKVQKDFGVDFFVSSWKPSERYLLINGIEFIYIKTKPGDVIITKTDIVYWVVSDYCHMVHWYLMPDFRVEECAFSYRNSKSDSHKFNLPLVCIEYLNLHLEEVTSDLMAILKKVVSDGVDEEYWTGNFSVENIDYRSCSLCGKDLVWRYARCPLCLVDKLITALCLKCAQEHKCKSLEMIEKYSTQDLEKFYNRLEKRVQEPPQANLCKVNVCQVEVAAGDTIKYDPERVITKEDYRNLVQQVQTKKICQKPQESQSFVRAQWNLDDVYKRLGKKKQKIREAMENPIHGPRFNYEFEGKKEREVPDVPYLKIPIVNKAKENPLSKLVKEKKGNSLSALISIDRKKELEEKRKMK